MNTCSFRAGKNIRVTHQILPCGLLDGSYRVFDHLEVVVQIRAFQRIIGDIFKFGEMIDIHPKEVLPLLITRVAVTSLAYFAISLQNIEIPIISIDNEYSIQSITEIWENKFQIISKNASKVNEFNISTFKMVLEEIFSSFYKGIFEYMKFQSIDIAMYKEIVNKMIDLIFRLMKNSPEQELKKNIITAATKGGLLETCMRFYDDKILPRLAKKKLVKDLNQIFYNELSEEFTHMCNAILNHGKKLLS